MKMRRTPSGKMRRKQGTKKLAAAAVGVDCTDCDCIPPNGCTSEIEGVRVCETSQASYPVTFSSVVVDTAYIGFASFAGTYCVYQNAPCQWLCILNYPDIPFEVTQVVRQVLDEHDDLIPAKDFKRCGIYLRIELLKLTPTSARLRAQIYFPGSRILPVTGHAFPIFDLFDKTFTTTAGVCFPTSSIDNGLTDATTPNTGNGEHGYGGTAMIGTTLCTPCGATTCGYAGYHSPSSFGESLDPPAWNDSSIRWFVSPRINGLTGLQIIDFPEGDCRLTYLCGALAYDKVNDSGFTVSRDEPLHRYALVDSGGTVIATVPGPGTQYQFQSEVEWNHSLDGADFTHTGGQLGIKLLDDDYANNILDGSDPFPQGAAFKICCGPVCYEVSAHIADDDVVLFDGGNIFPAGDYELSYVRGALTYSDGSSGGAQGYRVNTGGFGGEPGYFLTDESGTNILGAGVNAPGTNSQQTTQADVETASAGDSITFTLTSDSKLGIQLHDAGAYADNAIEPGGEPPRFRICPVTE